MLELKNLQIEVEDSSLLDDAKIELLYRETMEDIGDFAVRSFERHVPVFSGRMLSHIHKGDVERHPWGFSIDVGILPIEGASDPEYPRYVDQGSGAFAYNRVPAGTPAQPGSRAPGGQFGTGERARVYAPAGNVFAFE